MRISTGFSMFPVAGAFSDPSTRVLRSSVASPDLAVLYGVRLLFFLLPSFPALSSPNPAAVVASCFARFDVACSVGEKRFVTTGGRGGDESGGGAPTTGCGMAPATVGGEGGGTASMGSV